MTHEYEDYIDDRIDDKIEELAKDPDILFDSLGPNAFDNTKRGKELYAVYVEQLTHAVIMEDAELLGKVMMKYSRAYLERVAEDILYDEYPDYVAGKEDYFISMQD